MVGRIRTVQEHNIGKKKFVFEKKQTRFQKKVTVLLSLSSLRLRLVNEAISQ